MTIRHLKIFIAVADTGKMSAAAEKLYISQPSVSQAIRELEAHYQTLLLNVSRKSCSSQKPESVSTATPDLWWHSLTL